MHLPTTGTALRAAACSAAQRTVKLWGLLTAQEIPTELLCSKEGGLPTRPRTTAGLQSSADP